MKNLKHQAYDIIKEKILNCEYAPNTMINEEMLCQDTGMSRTPIRDAVSRLEQEGLVRIFPKKGIQISRFTFHDVTVLFEARTVLELYAIRSHAHKIPRESLIRMMEQFQAEASSENVAHTYQTDDAFHTLLIRSTDNDFFIESYAHMRNQIRRLRVLNGRNAAENRQRIQASAREHIAIIQNILDGKPEEAAREMNNHLTASQVSAFSVLMKDNYQEIRFETE